MRTLDKNQTKLPLPCILLLKNILKTRVLLSYSLSNIDHLKPEHHKPNPEPPGGHLCGVLQWQLTHPKLECLMNVITKSASPSVMIFMSNICNNHSTVTIITRLSKK